LVLAVPELLEQIMLVLLVITLYFLQSLQLAVEEVVVV
jgi:hypothetical protein